ncbi:MAG: RHS repeat-associated core domain-containing protein [Pyrinomonadaceae bacterium]
MTENNRQTIFLRTPFGRLLYAKQPEQQANAAFVAGDPITGNTQWSVKYEYDDNGNITKTTDARGIYVAGTYDNLNRLSVRNYSDATPDVSFYYDGKGLGTQPAYSKGKTTRVASSVSETLYTSFDKLGRLLTHEQITDGQTYNTGYNYNLSGALTEETYPSGRVVKSVLNNDGELSRVQSRKNASQGLHTYAGHFEYDAAGAVTKMRLGNGKWESAKYNSRLQSTEIALGKTQDATNLLRLELGYGTSTQNNGSLRSQKITFDGLANPFEQTYTYDDLNRLQAAEEKVVNVISWKQTFTIDRYGNRRFDAANTTTLGSCAEAVCNPTVSTSNNRISSNGYGFDATGNVTQDAEGRHFIYDAENHQTELKDNLNNTIGEYLYDGEGKRVKKISASETTIFVYNANGKLVAEYSTEISQTPQVSFLTQDHLGSPRVVTDENGIVTSRKDFTAFGEQNYTAQRTESLGYEPDTTRKGYTGYENDSESGLDFAQARYYNSTHGRYTSIDPLTASASIRNPQTFNRYSYVLNSPYKFTDPLGLIPVTTGACGQFCANSGPTVDGSSLRGRDASFDWAGADISLPNVTATSRGPDGRITAITEGDRKALQKSLQKLAAGSRVIKNGQITVSRSSAQTAGYNLLIGIGSSDKRVIINVNHENDVSSQAIKTDGSVNWKAKTDGSSSDAIVYWDPDAIKFAEERVGPNQIESVQVHVEVLLAHELIHAYNRMRGGIGGHDQLTGDHYFTEGNLGYYENAERTELRAVGYGFNQPGDITENQIRSQLGYQGRSAYLARKYWSLVGQ